MLHVMATKPLLPAIVIGYRSWMLSSPNQLADAEYKYWSIEKEFPRWLIQLEHQAGGTACSQQPTFGCALSLESNRDMARKDPADLIRFLRLERIEAMQDASDHVFTMESEHGYERATLDYLQNFLGDYFRLPSIASGEQAFLAFNNVNPLSYFQNWKVTSFRLKENANPAPHWAKGAYGLPLSQANVYADVTDLCLSTDFELDAAMLSELWTFRSYFSRHGSTEEPGAFLVWDNGD